MAASLLHLPIYNADTSVFASVHNAMITAGLTQTADTGQLSMASAPTYSTTSANNYGYTIYRFADAAQSTSPVFLKFEWRNATVASPQYFNFFVTVGTGSDGAGTITGIQQAARSIVMGAATLTASATAQFYTVVVSGDGSSLAIAYGFDHPNANGATSSPQQFFFIDRFRDSSGAAKTTGYIWQYGGTIGGSPVVAYYSTTYGVTTYAAIDSVTSTFTTQLPAFHPWLGTATTEQAGGAYQCFPIWLLNPLPEYIKAGICVPNQDFPSFGTFSVTNLGATHTYITCGGTGAVRAGYANRSTATGTLAILFE